MSQKNKNVFGFRYAIFFYPNLGAKKCFFLLKHEITLNLKNVDEYLK